MTARRMPPCPAEQARRHARELRSLADRFEGEAREIEGASRSLNARIGAWIVPKDAGPPLPFFGPGLLQAKK